MERLEAVELLPFRRVAPFVASIMTAHVVFESLDPERPATMSRPALDGILRDRFGYDGVVISDDLEMKAIADHYRVEEAVVEGVRAGVDLFLVCHHEEVQARAIEALLAAVRAGRVPEARIAEAGRRVDRLVERYVRPPVGPEALAVLGCDDHRRALAPLERLASLQPTGTDPTAA
jgi:beta-N-acetylhexosaminidase